MHAKMSGRARLALGVGIGVAIAMAGRWRERLWLPGRRSASNSSAARQASRGAQPSPSSQAGTDEEEVKERMTEGLPEEQLGPPESTLPEPPPDAS
jgi:hypothetical protein